MLDSTGITGLSQAVVSAVLQDADLSLQTGSKPFVKGQWVSADTGSAAKHTLGCLSREWTVKFSLVLLINP